MSIQASIYTTGLRLTDKSGTEPESAKNNFKKTETKDLPRKEKVSTGTQGSGPVETKNRLAQSLNRKIDYHIQQDNNKVIIQVRDGETGEVIRQIPQEEFVRLADRISEFNRSIVDDFA